MKFCNYRSKATFLLSFLFLFMLLSSCSSSTKSTTVYTLKTSVEPAEAGEVTPLTAEAEKGNAIQITASPNEHWEFVGWTGDLTGTNQPTVYVHMDKDRSVIALFEKVDYPFTINVEGEGNVSTEIVSQKSTTEEYPHATVLKLTAEPDYGWEFYQWDGAVISNDPEIEIEIDGPIEVTAIFVRQDFTLRVNVEGEGSIEQEIIAAQIIETDYPFESYVQLTAIPVTGWKFVGWSNDLGNNEVIVLEVTEEIEITATFEPIIFNLAVLTEGLGNVQKQVNGVITTQENFPFGTEVTLTATPATGWSFNAWATEDDSISEDPQLTVLINQNRIIKVEFIVKRQEAPSVITSAASNVGETTAVLGGNVTNDGNVNVTDRGICWSTSPNPSGSIPCQSAGNGTGTFTTNITGLSSGTTYYASAYATNLIGSGVGDQISFTTSGSATSPPPSSPPPSSGQIQIAVVFLSSNFAFTSPVDIILNGQRYNYFGRAFSDPIWNVRVYDGDKMTNARGHIITLNENLSSVNFDLAQVQFSGFTRGEFGNFNFKILKRHPDTNLNRLNNDSSSIHYWAGVTDETGVLQVYNDPDHPSPTFPYFEFGVTNMNIGKNTSVENWNSSGKFVIVVGEVGNQ